MQVHRSPALLRRILLRLQAPGHYFLLNIDRKSPQAAELEAALQGIDGVLLVSHRNVMHGGFSQVECTVMQLRFALEQPQDFAYYHTLSGQDYPCVSTAAFDAFFADNDRSYLMLDSDAELADWRRKKYPDRVNHWHFQDVCTRPWMRKLHLAGALRRACWWLPRRPAIDPNTLVGGWNWFSIREPVVRYLLDAIDRDPAFYNRFRYTASADELLFQTLLFDRREALHIERRNSLRYVDWHPTRPCAGLPLVLDERDFDAVVASGAFFCRKVDEVQSKTLLDRLDAHADRTRPE